jgi:2-oxo-4-hydroxy-4-carboxy-5-ureidoimidazoline decarboxylase
MMTSYKTLEEWSLLGPQAAAAAILPCNGSLAWAEGVVALRPLRGVEELLAASDKIWLGLSKKAWQHAFDSHPRIGEHKAKAATEQSLAWSSGEQSAAQLTEETQAALAAANVEYEQRFGRIFIVCASGKTAAEMLEILRGRLANDAETELHEAGEQQRLITQIRLRKWLQSSQEGK